MSGARRDPVRTIAVLVPALVAAALIPFLVRTAYRTVTTSTQGQSEPTVPRLAQLPPTPAFLVITDDGEGVPVAAVLLAPAPSGSGGAVVVVPLGTVTTGASGRPERLDAGVDEPGAEPGVDRVAANVEGLLGITLAGRVRLSPADLAGVLGPLTPVDVRLVDAVRTILTDGSEIQVLGAGPRTLSAVDAAAVLTARGDESELVRVDRAEEVWRALLPTDPRPQAAPGATGSAAVGPAVVAEALATLARGRTVVRTLAVAPLATPAGEPERFTADVVALRLLMAEIVPAAVSPAEASVRIRIRNPSGDEAAAYLTVGKLLAAGAAVILVDNTVGAVPGATGVTYADTARADALAAAVAGIGPVTLATTDERIDGIDATITLGTDVVAAARRVAPTTTAPPPTTSAVAPSTSTAAAGPSTTKKIP